MNIVAIIPSRYGSSRFPGKPLTLINGLPMIIHVANRTSKVIDKNNIYIATDDDRIKKVVESFGYHCIMTGECLTGTDRVCECIKQVSADIYINIQGDEPAILPEHINEIIETKKKNYDTIINCMTYLNEDINNVDTVKVVTNEKNNLIYASRSPIPFKTDQYYRQLGLYAFSRYELEEYSKYNSRSKLENFEDVEILRFLDIGMKIKMICFDKYYPSVDKVEDVEKVKLYCDKAR